VEDIEGGAVGEDNVVVGVDNLCNFVVVDSVVLGEDGKEEDHSRLDSQNLVVVVVHEREHLRIHQELQ